MVVNTSKDCLGNCASKQNYLWFLVVVPVIAWDMSVLSRHNV